MSLEEKTVIDLIQVVENGVVQVREKVSIYRNGEEISYSFHRWTVSPGEDYSTQPEKVRAICSAAHTPDVVIKWREQQLVDGNKSLS